MKVAILIAPKDFKDETVSQLQLLFGKKDIEAQIVSLTLKTCMGYHGATLKPQIDARSIEAGTFDVLLIADGPGVESLKLYDHRPLLDVVKAFHDNNKKVAGIGNGIRVIARANVIKDTRIAKTDEDTEKLVRLYRGKPSDDFVVTDKNIITASDASNVPDFVSVLSQ
ncbi:MAG: DJ-1/PfpI family protein [Candidatus Micrarchaeota archaeon]|nr:DJ-1/PfpI family protein [Candidatus Micrarchaeota archaeon]